LRARNLRDLIPFLLGFRQLARLGFALTASGPASINPCAGAPCAAAIMSSDYLAAAIAIIAGVGMACLLSLAAKYLGGTQNRPTKNKGIPYEAGSDVIGSPRARFSVKFYQVAILFLVFDIEAAFMYPWAVNYGALSCKGPLGPHGTCAAGISFFGLGGVIVFMGILVVALAYVWRKRAVGWE
jgi:NADH-quinone oxidoreductase subunit A